MRLGSPDALLRVSLLGCLAATQITLAHRAEVPDFVIMAGLSWLGGSLLLVEHELQGAAVALRGLPGPMFLAGVVGLAWSLLVLSFAAQLYDPLFWVVPLAALTGLGLLAGLSWRARLLREVIAIALLLPAQGLLNALWPRDALAQLTAHGSAFLLWLIGTPAFAEGRVLVLPDRLLLVDGPCTGYATLSLGVATLVLLIVLLPLPAVPARFRRALPWLGAVVLLLLLGSGFLINAARIALLAHTVPQDSLPALAFWRGFDFWHVGAGAQLFSLLASGVICGSYLLVLEALRRHRFRRPFRP